jgi:hypothetical protein
MRILLLCLLLGFLVNCEKKDANSPPNSKRYTSFESIEVEFKNVEIGFGTAERRIYHDFFNERQRIFEIADGKVTWDEIDRTIIRKMAWVILYETRRREAFDLHTPSTTAEIDQFPSDE